MAYAQGTTVAAERSRLELEKMLRKFGATEFAYGWDRNAERVGFTIAGRSVRMVLPMPDPDSVEFTRTPAGRVRTSAAAAEAHTAEVRRRWRSLVLVVKAKLTAVADGISTIEREFLADVVVGNGNGQTFSEWIAPHLDAGTLPALPAGRS